MFHLAGIILSSFLALLLFTKKGRLRADLILALWLSLISFHLLAYYLLTTGSFIQFPYLLGFEIPLPLIHGPFLYLYVAALSGQNNTRLPWYIHFTPAVAAYFLLAGFLTLSLSQKVAVYQNNGIGYHTILSIIRFPIVPSGFIYIAGSLLLLKRHRENISKEFSYSDRIDLTWLVHLTVGMGIIWVSIIFGNDMSTFILVDVFILFIGYFGIKQVGIFANQAMADKRTVRSFDTPTEKTKYLKTGVGDELMSKIHLRLTLLIRAEKPYKDPELKLDDLAGRLGVSSNIVSQVINAREGRNFYDYINDLRIQEFKHLVALPENDRFTLLSIAFDAGFNSKTSFNRNFKKATGLSPKAYCQQGVIQVPTQA